MKYKYYYQLLDLAKSSSWEFNKSDSVSLGDNFYLSLYDIVNQKLDWSLSVDASNLLQNELVNELWFDYILPMYLKENIAICDEDILEETPDSYNEVFGEWMRKFIGQLKVTFTRYSTLIKLYKDNETKLLDAVKSISQSQFNDTPQESSVLASPEYASNVTTTTSTSDLTTMMNRLEEIHDKWNNIFKEWADEFDSLFMEDF